VAPVVTLLREPEATFGVSPISSATRRAISTTWPSFTPGTMIVLIFTVTPRCFNARIASAWRSPYYWAAFVLSGDWR
jgi:CHAT domain-containing protein